MGVVPIDSGMAKKIPLDDLGPIAEELYNALNNARAFRGRIEARDPLGKSKAADRAAILQIEEDLVIIMGRMSLAGVPVPQMPSTETAPEPSA